MYRAYVLKLIVENNYKNVLMNIVIFLLNIKYAKINVKYSLFVTKY